MEEGCGEMAPARVLVNVLKEPARDRSSGAVEVRKGTSSEPLDRVWPLSSVRKA